MKECKLVGNNDCQTQMAGSAEYTVMRINIAILSCALLFLISSTASKGAGEDDAIARKFGLTVEEVKELRTEKGFTRRRFESLPAALGPQMKQALMRSDEPNRRAEANDPQVRKVTRTGEPYFNPTELLISQYRKVWETASRDFGNVAGIPVGPLGKGREAGLTPGAPAWKFLGPTNVGGRCRAMLIDPDNPSRLFVASIGGGVWISNDGGKSFAPLHDFLDNLVVCTMTFDPLNKGRIFLGTGESFQRLRGAGLISLEKYGETWKKIDPLVEPSLTPDFVVPQKADFDFVNKLAFSADGNTFYAATNKGLFISRDRERKYWRGISALSGSNVTDLIAHPTDHKRALLSTMNGQVMWTADGGTTWSKSLKKGGIWTGRAAMCYAAADANVVYASVDGQRSNIPSVIWRSENGGETFMPRATRDIGGERVNYLEGQGDYSNTIWAGNPHDLNFVVVGGLDLWRSRDGGDTLIDISVWFVPESVHADHHAIVSSPQFEKTGAGRVYFLNDGGLFATDDIEACATDPNRIEGWINLNRTLGITQFYSAAINADGSVLVAGAQDNGNQITNLKGPSPETWSTMSTGDGGVCGADSKDPSILYAEYIYLTLQRSTDGGKSSEDIFGVRYYDSQTRQNVLMNPPYVIEDANYKGANFIAPFVVDPNNNDRILAGGLRLWQTMNSKQPLVKQKNINVDSGPEWHSIKPSINDPDHYPGFISAIAIDSADSKRVAVGHNSGQLYITENSLSPQPDWQPIDSNQFPKKEISDIHLSGKDIYVSFDAFAVKSLWHSGDRGQTWEALNAELLLPVRSVTVHPRRPDYLYAGTELGVFASANGGKSWSLTNEGPTNTPVYDLVWKGNDLYAVTFGRGVFKISIAR